MPQETINSNAGQILKYCLRILGINVNENYTDGTVNLSRSYLQVIIYHIVSIIVLILCVFGIYHFINDMDSIVDGINDVVLMSFSIVSSIIIVSKMSELQLMYMTLQNRLYEYKIPIVVNETEVRSKFLHKAISFVYVGAIIIFIANICKILLHMVFGTYQLTVNGWKEEIKLPLTFACWVPFLVDNLFKYLCVYFFVALVGLWITLHFLGLSSFLVLTIMYIKHEIEILILAIETIKDTAYILTNSSANNYYETLTTLQKETVEHHNRIISFVSQTNKLFDTILLSFMGLIVLTLSVCGYRLSVESNLFSSSSLSYFNFLLGVIGETFLFSWLGQSIIDQDTKLRISLNNFEWDYISHSFNKNLLIMVEKENRPLYIKYGTIYILDLGTFSNLMQAAYSFFNLLRSARF